MFYVFPVCMDSRTFSVQSFAKFNNACSRSAKLLGTVGSTRVCYLSINFCKVRIYEHKMLFVGMVPRLSIEVYSTESQHVQPKQACR